MSKFTELVERRMDKDNPNFDNTYRTAKGFQNIYDANPSAGLLPKLFAKLLTLIRRDNVYY